MAGMSEWQNRPLASVYPVVFIDCVNVKVRDGQVANRPVYLAVAVTAEGHRDILGLWIGDGGEGAKHWLQVLTEIKNRGAADVLMLVCDGLTGLPDAVNTVWPATIVQTSSVHTPRWRETPAGHRASGRGPMQTRCLRGPHADQSLPLEAGRELASGSCATSAEMRYQRGRPVGDGRAGRRPRGRHPPARTAAGLSPDPAYRPRLPAHPRRPLPRPLPRTTPGRPRRARPAPVPRDQGTWLHRRPQPAAPLPQPGPHEGDRPVTTPRHASRLLLTDPKPAPGGNGLLERIATACPEMTALANLLRGFAALLKPAEGNDVKLTEWIMAARAVDLRHLRSLTNGLEIDRPATDAADRLDRQRAAAGPARRSPHQRRPELHRTPALEVPDLVRRLRHPRGPPARHHHRPLVGRDRSVHPHRPQQRRKRGHQPRDQARRPRSPRLPQPHQPTPTHTLRHHPPSPRTPPHRLKSKTQ